MGRVSRRILDSSSTDADNSARKEAAKTRPKRRKRKKDLEQLRHLVTEAKGGLRRNGSHAKQGDFVKLLNNFAEKREEYERKTKGLESKSGKTRGVRKICDRILPRPRDEIYRNGAQGKEIRRRKTKITLSNLDNARKEGNVFQLLDGYESKNEKTEKAENWNNKNLLFDNANKNVLNPTPNDAVASRIFGELLRDEEKYQKDTPKEKLSRKKGPSPLLRYEQLCGIICSENFKGQDLAKYNFPDPLTVIKKKLRSVYSTAFRTKFLQNANEQRNSGNAEEPFCRKETLVTDDSGFPEIKYRSLSNENNIQTASDAVQQKEHRNGIEDAGSNIKEEDCSPGPQRSIIFTRNSESNFSNATADLRRGAEINKEEITKVEKGTETRITPKTSESGLETNISNLLPMEVNQTAGHLPGFLKKSLVESVSTESERYTMLFGKELSCCNHKENPFENEQSKVSIHINPSHKKFRMPNLRANQRKEMKHLKHPPMILKKQDVAQRVKRHAGDRNRNVSENATCSLFPKRKRVIKKTNRIETMIFNSAESKETKTISTPIQTEICFEKNACTQSDTSRTNISEAFFENNFQRNKGHHPEKVRHCILGDPLNITKHQTREEKICSHCKNCAALRESKKEEKRGIHFQKEKQPSNVCIVHQNCHQISIGCSQKLENSNFPLVHGDCDVHQDQNKTCCCHAFQNPETQIRENAQSMNESLLFERRNCKEKQGCEKKYDFCRTKSCHTFQKAYPDIRGNPQVVSNDSLSNHKCSNVMQCQKPCHLHKNLEVECQKYECQHSYQTRPHQTFHYSKTQIPENNSKRAVPSEKLFRYEGIHEPTCKNIQNASNENRVCYVILDKNQKTHNSSNCKNYFTCPSQDSCGETSHEKISTQASQRAQFHPEAAADVNLLRQVQNLRILSMEEEDSETFSKQAKDGHAVLIADSQPVKYLAFEDGAATQRIPIYTQKSVARLEEFEGRKSNVDTCTNEQRIVLVPQGEQGQVIYVRPQDPVKDCSYVKKYLYCSEIKPSNKSLKECGAAEFQKKVRVQDAECERHLCSLRNAKNISEERNNVNWSQVQYPASFEYAQSDESVLRKKISQNTVPIESGYVICYKE